MFVYAAEDHERTLLRGVLGEAVQDVTLWDAEDPGDGFDLLTAYDDAGQQLAAIDTTHPRFGEIVETMAGGRGHTVKFGLDLR